MFKIRSIFLVLSFFLLSFSAQANSWSQGLLVDIYTKSLHKVEQSYEQQRVGKKTVMVPVYKEFDLVFDYMKIKQGGIFYDGVVKTGLFSDFHPEEFIIGTNVQVRFDKKFMYVLRPNGKEFKCKIVRKSKTK